MISDAALADICLGSYAKGYQWDWKALSKLGVWVAIKRVGDLDVVCFRGSVTIDDWIRDLVAVPETVNHPELGPLHAGFAKGMQDVTDLVRWGLRPEVTYAVTGHSLGAARAWIFAGMMLKVRMPSRVCVFGSPRPGFARLAAALAAPGIISMVSYRNATPIGHDRVTDLPPAFPPELPWCQPVALTDIAEPPDPADLSPFRFHHMALYGKGMGA